MSQSLADILVHVVFSTKDRLQTIHPKIEEELHHYIIGICREYNCVVLAINSVPDHIHILLSLDKNLSISQIVSMIKSNSSRWIKSKSIHFSTFTWQNGYASFSVSRSSISGVINYIKMQKKHHDQLSFKDELISMLNKAGIEYNEKYFFGE